MIEVRQYKQLQSQLNKMVGDADALKIEVAIKQKEHQQKLKAIENLKIEMAKLNTKETFKVSEHAVLRYFERVKGFNIGDIEKEILPENIKILTNTIGGNGKFAVNGFSIVMKNFTITTVVID